MEALDDVVKAGKARYIGASSMFAWQFAKLQHAAERNGWTKFVSMQDQYNLVQRGEEQEMFPLLADQGVGRIPWSPLAGGVVARPWGEANTARGKDSSSTDFEGARSGWTATNPPSTPSSALRRPGRSRWRRSPWPGC